MSGAVAGCSAFDKIVNRNHATETMRPLKLHTKTTLLASAITVAVLIVALLTISARVVDLVRDEQKALAEWQAISLAEAISDLPTTGGPQDMANAVALVRSSRPNMGALSVCARQAAWCALVAVALTTLSTYLLFRRLVYTPIERLLGVIARAKAGELEAQAPPRPPDELGRLSQEFNSLDR